MNVELLFAPDSRWHDILSRIPHDIYHRQEFALLESQHRGAQAAALYGIDRGGNEFFIPLIISPLPSRLRLASSSWRDASVPNGYPAPVCSASCVESLNRFLQCATRVAREHDIISLFLRWHPMLSFQTRDPIEGETIVEHGETVYIDLSDSADELIRQTHSGHRYEIRRLKKLGFRATVDDWSHLGRFNELYEQTMQRVGARESYRYSLAYFRELHDLMSPHVHIASVISPNGEVAASGLFTECGEIVQYYLSCSDNRFLRWAPTKLLLDHICLWAKERGNRMFHLGGGVGGQKDSLFEFKAGFSKHRRSFQTSRIITDFERYRVAVASNQVGQPSMQDGYFPAYRQAA